MDYNCSVISFGFEARNTAVMSGQDEYRRVAGTKHK